TGAFTNLIIQGDVTLNGGGSVALGNHANNRIYGAAATNTLTNVDNTIRGAGQIGVGLMELINRGTVLANAIVTLTLDPPSSFVNQGIFRAAAGSTLRLQS